VFDYPPECPRYMALYDASVRPRVATGTETGFWMSTANSFFRRSLIAAMPQPFDPRYGRTGGEDVVFFDTLKAAGARVIWCNEALTHGVVDPSRARIRWSLIRSFREGNILVEISTPPLGVRHFAARGKRTILLLLKASVASLRGIFDA